MSRRPGRQGYNDIRRLRERRPRPPSEVWLLARDLLFAGVMLLLAGFLIVVLASINW